MTPDGEQEGRDDGGPQQHAQGSWDGIRHGGGALAAEVGHEPGAAQIQCFRELGFLLGDGARHQGGQQARDGGGLQPLQLGF